MHRLRALLALLAVASLITIAAAVALAAPSAVARTASGLSATLGMYGTPPDLTLELTADPETVAPGGGVVFRITVRNKPERGGATGVEVTFEVPGGLEIVATKANRGPGLCTGTTKMSCFLDFLSPIHIGQVIVTAKTKTAGTVVFAASVASDQPDAKPDDNKAQVTVSVQTASTGSGSSAPRRIVGSARGERLRGTARDDRIFGRGGNDTIYGLAGNDVLDGGPGRDRLFGGPGNDTLNTADRELDVVDCGAGKDTVHADARDRVSRNCEKKR